MEKSIPVDWQFLTTQDEQVPNIRMHQLHGDEDLLKLLEDFRQSHVVAAVFINNEENYTLSWEMASKVKEVPFPLLLVKNSDGKQILTSLKCQQRIQAKVAAENEVDNDIKASSQQKSGKRPPK